MTKESEIFIIVLQTRYPGAREERLFGKFEYDPLIFINQKLHKFPTGRYPSDWTIQAILDSKRGWGFLRLHEGAKVWWDENVLLADPDGDEYLAFHGRTEAEILATHGFQMAPRWMAVYIPALEAARMLILEGQ